jgi:Na+/H+-dicarboxylate symporter
MYTMYVLPIVFAALIPVLFTMYQAANLCALLYQVACVLYHETAACVFVYALVRNELQVQADMRRDREQQANAARHGHANFRPNYHSPVSAPAANANFRPILPSSAPAAA